MASATSGVTVSGLAQSKAAFPQVAVCMRTRSGTSHFSAAACYKVGLMSLWDKALPGAEHCAQGGPGRARPCSCAWLLPVPQGRPRRAFIEIRRAGPDRSRRLVRLASPCSVVAAPWPVLRIREITAW